MYAVFINGLNEAEFFTRHGAEVWAGKASNPQDEVLVRYRAEYGGKWETVGDFSNAWRALRIISASL